MGPTQPHNYLVFPREQSRHGVKTTTYSSQVIPEVWITCRCTSNSALHGVDHFTFALPKFQSVLSLRILTITDNSRLCRETVLEGAPEAILQAQPCRRNVDLYLQMVAPDPSEQDAFIYQTTRSHISQDYKHVFSAMRTSYSKIIFCCLPYTVQYVCNLQHLETTSS